MSKLKALIIGVIALIAISCDQQVPDTISLNDTMDGILTRLYEEFTPEELMSATPEFILSNIQPQERRALSTKYWYFDVNMPVVVSVMRHEGQQVVPFWLEETGFSKTDLKVSNEEYTYEIWQKEFPTGKVELGISGFENHRTPYFVSVGKAQKNSPESLNITNIFF